MPETRSGKRTSLSPSSTSKNIPPPRTSSATRRVDPPLANISLHKFIYILALLTSLLAAYFSYRTIQYKSEAGGWWNLAVGRRPPQMQNYDSAGTGSKHKGQRESVEERINGLASALGMPSSELASAIAVAVRQYVPPASLSSVAARESGTAVDVLVHGGKEGETTLNSVPEKTATPGVVGGVVSGMESFVGMDEP